MEQPRGEGFYYVQGNGTKNLSRARVRTPTNINIPADDFDASVLEKYSSIAFGCPSMGDEILEEDVFEPMFSSVEQSLSGRRVGLFGSYGWGDGQWMRDWEDRCRSSGIDIVGSGVIANEFPDGEAAEECRALGRNLCA